MPAAAAAWLSGVAYAATASVIVADIVLVAGYYAINLAIAAGLSKLAQSQVNERGRFLTRDFPIASGKAPETIIYGEAWTSGVVMYAGSFLHTGSKDNWTVIKAFAHTGHQCADISDIFYDNDLVQEGIDFSDWASSPLNIDAGKYGVSRTIDGNTYYAVNLEAHLGTSTQAQSDLLTAGIPADFPASPGLYRARGYCYTVHQFNYFSKTSKTAEGIFFSGVPENVRVKLKGRLCYDPSRDSTVSGGSGTHRYATPSTWEWSANPIVCAADYMTQYMGMDPTEIDWAWMIPQIAICDATVSVPGVEGFRSDFLSTADSWTTSGLTATTNPTYWTIDSTGSDPVIRRTLSFSGATYRYVRARVRRAAGSSWDGTVYYTTGGHGESASFIKTISDTTVSGQWVLLEWDMHALTVGGSDWASNTITGLRIDLGSSSADTFDIESIIVSAAATQPRYSCNGELSCTSAHGDNIDAILSSCLGTRPYINGQYKLTAGAYVAADVTITDDDVVNTGDSGVSFVGSFKREERYNTVNSVYYAASGYAQEIDSLRVQSLAYVARDNGRELTQTLKLPMVNNEYLAQLICFKHLAQSDRQITVDVQLRWTGLQIQPGTRVNFTYTKHNWVNKTFRCVALKFGGNSPIQVTLREDDSAGWADPLIGDYSTRNAQGSATFADAQMPTPTAGSGSIGEVTVQNGNFEAGATATGEAYYWEHTAVGEFEIVQDSSLAHQGNWVARCIDTGNHGSVIKNYVRAPCNAGMRVAFGGYMSTTSDWNGPGGNGSAQFIAQFLADDGESEISTVGTVANHTASTPWTMFKHVAVAPANTHFVKLMCICTQNAGYCYFDDTFMNINVGVGQEVGADVTVSSGTGSPEGVVTAPVGSLYLRIDGSTSTTLYVKTSGSGNTGWTAK